MPAETEPSSIRKNPARGSMRTWKGRSGNPSGSVRVCAGSHTAWRPKAASATPAAAPSGKAKRLAKAAFPAGISPATATTSQAAATSIERELQELVRAVDVLGFDDFRDAEVDFGELLDRYRSVCRRADGRGHRGFLRWQFEQRVELFFFDTGDQVFILSDAVQRFPELVPFQRELEPEQSRNPLRRFRQNRRQEQCEAPKCIDAVRAHLVQALLLIRALGEFPGFLAVNRFIDSVRELHRLANDFSEFPLFIVSGDPLFGIDRQHRPFRGGHYPIGIDG